MNGLENCVKLISYSVLAIEKNCNKTKCILIIIIMTMCTTSSHVTLQPKTDCPLKLSRVELVSTLMGDLLGKLGCCMRC